MLEPCSSCFPICFCNWQGPTHRQVKVTFLWCNLISIGPLPLLLHPLHYQSAQPARHECGSVYSSFGILQLVHAYVFGAAIPPCLLFVRLLILLSWRSIAWIWVTLVLCCDICSSSPALPSWSSRRTVATHKVLRPKHLNQTYVSMCLGHLQSLPLQLSTRKFKVTNSWV